MSYQNLYHHFNEIQEMLTRKLQQFEKLGFVPSNGHLFGFNIGSHIALEAAYKYGIKKVGRIEACDSDGKLFSLTSPLEVHANNAAQEVHYTNTSADFGSDLLFCQKSINMKIWSF